MILFGNNAVGVVTGAVAVLCADRLRLRTRLVTRSPSPPRSGPCQSAGAVTGSLSQFVGPGLPASTAIPVSRCAC